MDTGSPKSFCIAFVEWKPVLKDISQQIRETRAKLCYLLPERKQAKHKKVHYLGKVAEEETKLF